MSKSAPSNSFPIQLSEPDQRALDAIAVAYRLTLPEAAATMVKVLLRSLPAPPEYPGTPLAQFIQDTLAQTSQLSAAAMKVVVEVDQAAARASALIDLLEPAIHRLQTGSV